MATPNAVLTHALEQLPPAPPVNRPGGRRLGRIRSGLLIGATAALTVAMLPATATAVPTEVTSPEQALQRVAEADRELGLVTEQLNEAKVVLEQQQAAVAAAEQAAADAQAKLDALDGQIRQLARTAFTGESYSPLDMMLTSTSVDQFVSQLGTLDAIAGHTNDLVTEVAQVSEEAKRARETAEQARVEAERSVEKIAAQQADLEKQIADFQRQHAALTAAQQEEVARAHAGEAVPAPARVAAAGGGVAPSGVVAPSAWPTPATSSRS